jgi:endonuclease/exonuclease/phosphatase family metal-dependent hydrolase
MASTFRVASFNCENLFSRAKALNLADPAVGDQVMEYIEELDTLLRKDTYTTANKQRILKLYQQITVDDQGNKLKDYIEIREDRGKLWKRSGFAITGVKASGKGDWDGAIEHKRAQVSDLARENTVKVVKAVKADVACVVEVENRPMLHSFNRELLGTRKFEFSMVIDGNDTRGIDVGLLSKFPLHGIWTHIYHGTPRSRTFSRDCLEVEVELPNGQMMFVLCNHLKSRGYGTQAGNDARRERQAEALRDILKDYDLANDWVVVAGDMNDSPDRPPRVLRHFLELPNLFDVLALEFPNNVGARWTYHFNGFEQIDYLLVSKPLKQRLVSAGVERRGIHRLKALTENAGNGIPVETEYDTVTHWTNAASDHGAVWAEFNL